jgi:hypothetical protein
MECGPLSLEQKASIVLAAKYPSTTSVIAISTRTKSAIPCNHDAYDVFDISNASLMRIYRMSGRTGRVSFAIQINIDKATLITDAVHA